MLGYGKHLKVIMRLWSKRLTITYYIHLKFEKLYNFIFV